MSQTQLKIYNGALTNLGERKLSSLTEARESRRVLDDIWGGGDLITYLLEQGLWNFATRTIQMDYDAGIDPDFGYSRGFSKPSDWVRIVGVSTDEYFNSPLLEYTDEAGYLFADDDTIYIRYVSDDSSYGGDLSLWPESFSEYAKAYMSFKASPRLTQNETKTEYFRKLSSKLLLDAKSRDAMNDPTAFAPTGSWVNSRSGSGRKPRRNSSGSWQF